jgi:glycerate 2-kinase
MKVLIAPDSFADTLTASEVARAIGEGWRRHRPDDQVRLLPLSDGGKGLLEVLATSRDRLRRVEVAGPQGHPVEAPVLLRSDGTAVIEAAGACGLHLLPPERRWPALATTYGVGQLVETARAEGSRHLVVGLGGSAPIDGGAGALTALGFRLRRADGSGLKIGGGELRELATIEPAWVSAWDDLEVELLADVMTPLYDAADRLGPQQGATPDEVERLTEGLEVLARVAERDLGTAPAAATAPGSGAGGGLGYGLVAGIGARSVPGASRVGGLLGFAEQLMSADLIVTGEARRDVAFVPGPVIDHVEAAGREHGVPVAAVVGRSTADAYPFYDVEEASPAGPDPAGDVVAAGARLAARR